MARSTVKRKRAPRPEAVVDTCVLLDATSVQGVAPARGKPGTLVPGPDYETPDVRRRRLRTRQALLLLEDFSERKAAFLYLGGEAGHLFRKPTPPTGTDFSTIFTSFFGNYVLDGQYWRWKAIRDESDAGKTGEDRAEHLVRLAARRKVPVITSETRKGGAVRREAARQGVKVLSPAEYRGQFITEKEALYRVLDGWEAGEEAFFSRARKACRDRRQAIELFGYLDAYLGDVMYEDLGLVRRSAARP